MNQACTHQNVKTSMSLRLRIVEIVESEQLPLNDDVSPAQSLYSVNMDVSHTWMIWKVNNCHKMSVMIMILKLNTSNTDRQVVSQ